ncbi:MAG: flagellar basal body-associated FliL family protein [Gemmatimonadetes bacterium]|nr:flagellar basal body-associated FliL family protein [Gemmatimonadota bacterium]
MAEETAAPAEAADAPPAKPKLVIVLALALAGLAAGGAAGALVAGPMIAKKLVPPPSAHADSGAAKAGEHAEKGKGGKDGEAEASFMLDNLVLNPAGSGGGRYLLASVSLRYANAALKEKFASREAEIRDAILHVLGTKSVEELSDFANRERFKKEITEQVDAIMGPRTVAGVFFSQFVLQ